MTYTPIADSVFNPPLAGSTAHYTTLLTNDTACFEEYTPGVEVNPSAAASSAAREYRWPVYGNYDNFELEIAVRAVATGGAQTVTFSTAPSEIDIESVTTVGWYTHTSSATGPRQEVIISNGSLGAATLAYSGLRSRVRVGVGAPVAGTLYASGYRRIGGIWDNSAYPVPSEIVSRLRTNPMRIARERPVCVAAHVCDTVKVVTTKSLDIWGVEDTTDWTRVGRLTVPKSDVRQRRYRVDAYCNEEDTPGTAEYSVQIGAIEERWSGAGWHSWSVDLGAHAHEVWANIAPGASNAAAIRTLTVWRTEL